MRAQQDLDMAPICYCLCARASLLPRYAARPVKQDSSSKMRRQGHPATFGRHE